MGIYIIKPDPDIDRYVAWSSIVDGPVVWGERDAVGDWLRLWEGPDANSPERFARADANGTSLLDGDDGWDCKALLVLNGGHSRGWLPRERVWEWLEADMPNEMLNPLEDD